MRLIRLLKKDLAKEVSSWVDKNLISIEQAQSICRLYDVDYDAIQSHTTGYRLLISLAYLFIGLAVITLLGANWDEIPRGLRMAALLAMTIGTHGLAFKFYLEGKTSNATGLFMLANLLYGASIILIAQIYHLGEHMPDGVFWWALATLPFGLLLRNTWLMLFSYLLALLWFYLEYSLGFFPTLFPLFIAAALYVLIKGQSNTLLFLTVVAGAGLWFQVLLSIAWSGQRYPFQLYAENFFVSVALAIFAYAHSHWLYAYKRGKAKDYATLLSLWVLRLGLMVMLILSYEDHGENLLVQIGVTNPLCGKS